MVLHDERAPVNNFLSCRFAKECSTSITQTAAGKHTIVHLKITFGIT